ncbi:MAG: diguanylate cyclase [Gammaproteobacteria bacterium]|nr:diguanylate cyclase [Gammaproteobacteria bacterium]
MTIFQKMLLTPIIALVLFTFATVYSYLEQQESSLKIENISKDYIPVLQIGNQNIMLFEQVNQQLKDAIVAAELAWLETSQTPSQQLIDNFNTLSRYKHILDEKYVGEVRLAFLKYYSLATELAKTAIAKDSILDINTALIDELEQTQQTSKNKLVQFNEDIKQRFLAEVQQTNQQMDNLLLTTSLISIASLAILLLVTLYVSLTTRSRIKQVIMRMKQLAQGETNFSHRLELGKRDEVSYLMYWFNKLTDKLEQSYLEIERVSITDQLTKLNNRVRCDSFLPAALSKAQKHNSPLSVVIMDIDHFKRINDTYGHLVGDNVLQQVAEVLKTEATGSDFIGRWGGEEFILIISNLSSQAAYQKVENLRVAIAQQNFDDVKHISASFGIASYHNGDTQNALIERADRALYQSKKAGRNCVTMDSSEA